MCASLASGHRRAKRRGLPSELDTPWPPMRRPIASPLTGHLVPSYLYTSALLPPPPPSFPGAAGKVLGRRGTRNGLSGPSTAPSGGRRGMSRASGPARPFRAVLDSTAMGVGAGDDDVYGWLEDGTSTTALP